MRYFAGHYNFHRLPLLKTSTAAVKRPLKTNCGEKHGCITVSELKGATETGNEFIWEEAMESHSIWQHESLPEVS